MKTDVPFVLVATANPTFEVPKIGSARYPISYTPNAFRVDAAVVLHLLLLLLLLMTAVLLLMK